MKKIILIHLIFLVLILTIGILAYFRFGIVATVNGQQITRFAQIKSIGSQEKQQALGILVEDTLIKQEAAKKKITISKDIIDGEVLKIENQLKAQNQTLKDALASHNMTQKDLEEQIRIPKLLEQLVPKVEVTQAQIDKLLVDNKDRLPKGSTKDELQTLAKNELATQLYNQAVNAWLTDLKTNAKITYR